MGHEHDADTSNLPGDHDDPMSWSTLYWMALCFVFVAVCAFALHGLTNWVEFGWNVQGTKAPGLATSELNRLRADQAQDLELVFTGDKLRLKSGLIINDGIVVQGVDPKDKKTKYFVKGLPFLKDKNLGKYTLSRAGKELKFLPDEVAGVDRGHGNKMAIPMQQAVKVFLGKHGRS